MKYFAHSPYSGYETFKKPEEAINWCNDEIDNFRNYSGDGWDDLVEDIYWGEIKQKTVIIARKTVKEAEEALGISLPSNSIGWVDYGLVDINKES